MPLAVKQQRLPVALSMWRRGFARCGARSKFSVVKKKRHSERISHIEALLQILALGNRQIEQGKVIRAVDAFRRVRAKMRRRW